MHGFRALVLLVLAAGLVSLPAIAPAAKKNQKAVKVPTAAECAPLPSATGEPPWEPGERLAYDIDFLGANAGKLVLTALPSVGTGSSREYPLRAIAASNSFVASVKRFRGRSTSYVRSRDLHPRRYREDSNEDGLIRSADVVFGKKTDGAKVETEWTKGKQRGKKTQRYMNEVFDPIAAAYYLRSIPLAAGQPLCFDAYGFLNVWRVSGSVKGIETVNVPAGTYQAYHFAGTAVRIDRPTSHREVHLWIGADEAKLPLAGMMSMNAGPIRAQLTSVGTAAGDESEEGLLGAARKGDTTNAAKPAATSGAQP